MGSVKNKQKNTCSCSAEKSEAQSFFFQDALSVSTSNRATYSIACGKPCIYVSSTHKTLVPCSLFPQAHLGAQLGLMKQWPKPRHVASFPASAHLLTGPGGFPYVQSWSLQYSHCPQVPSWLKPLLSMLPLCTWCHVDVKFWRDGCFVCSFLFLSFLSRCTTQWVGQVFKINLANKYLNLCIPRLYYSPHFPKPRP